MISLTKDNRMLGYELLSSYSNISHFVTTRQGGCSGGTYGSFNCSPYGDDKEENVLRNQQFLIEGMEHKPKRLLIPQQDHGLSGLVVNDTFLKFPLDVQQSMLRGLDALITQEPGYCLCVSTADCVPILLYDKKHQVVAAVHAGWRGTVGRLVNRVLEHMNKIFGTQGKDVIACIGPSISLQSFEVGEEVFEDFQKSDFDMSRISFWNEETGKHHIDLWEANRMQLLENGVSEGHIELAGLCTYIHHDQFFSARRLGVKSGRMLSGIMINK